VLRVGGPLVADPANNRQDEHDDPGVLCCFCRDFSAGERALRTVQLVTFQIENVVLDVRKSNGERKTERLQYERHDAHAVLAFGKSRKLAQQKVSDGKCNHRDSDVDGTGHFDDVRDHS